MRPFLVIAPHVDDEALGCGGILDERFHVHYCGVEEYHEVDRTARLAEASSCAELLGFSHTIDLDTTVNAYQESELIGRLEELVAEVQPHTVFLPLPSYNQDHRTVLDAGLVALRPHDRNHRVANVLLYEQIQVGIWPVREDLIAARTAHPQLFVPIDIDRKIAAYERHASQVRAMRPVEAVVALARWRGLQAGTPHAEAFVAARITDPTVLALGRLRATGS